MAEESKIRDVVEAAEGLVKAVPIYQDALQPAAKEIGVALETVAKAINVALTPVGAFVWGYEKISAFISARLVEKLKDVPAGRITTPEPSVAGPAIEALRWTGQNPVLRELYANLLATSLDSDTAHQAHPAFVDIIKSMSPDEARVMRCMATERTIPLVDVRESGANGAYIKAYANHTHLGRLAGCEHSALVPSYIDNLCRLGLLEVPAGVQMEESSFYQPLENDPDLQPLKDSIGSSPGKEVRFDRKLVHLTTFGDQFCKACVIEKRTATDRP